MNNTLTVKHLKKAIKILKKQSSPCYPIVLHPSLYEDYQKYFKLTDEQMSKWFTKIGVIK